MSTEPTSLEKAFHKAASPAEVGLFGVEATPNAIDAMRDANGKLPPNVFQLMRQAPGEARKPGRPKGAGNKRTEQLAKLITHKFGDPVEAMASLYATPLDQLVELVMIADGSQERQQELDALVFELGRSVRDLIKANGGRDAMASIDRLAEACEALESVARRSAGKPGDIAIKALNVQLAAAKATAEYVHSKKPVEATVSLKTDGVLVFPGGVAGSFEQLDEATRGAAAMIQQAVDSGSITTDMLAGMKLVDGQLMDAEWTEVDDENDDLAGGAGR